MVPGQPGQKVFLGHHLNREKAGYGVISETAGSFK
jgi:hypothetical protein